MAKRRPRLVPKVVFRVALTTAAVPMLAGCPQHLTVANRGYGVAERSYGSVAQRAYAPEGGTSGPELTVAAPAFVNPPPVDASSDATTDAKAEARTLDAGKADASKLDAGKRDAAGPVLVDRPPMPGVAAQGYAIPTASAGPPGPVKPSKP